MSKNGLMIGGNVISTRIDKKEKSSNNTIYNQSLTQESNSQGQQLLEQLDLINESKDVDSDSGVSSVRQSRGKVATSLSETTLATDDELEDEERLSARNNSSVTESDVQDRRLSDTSSITNFTINKTTSDFQLNSKATSRTPSINPLPSMTPTSGTKSRKLTSTASTTSNTVETKEKHGVRRLIQKIFKSSAAAAASSSNQLKSPASSHSTVVSQPITPKLNIDLVHGTAYPPLSPLPITQGPIRLLVLRHGERLDRYYSSQWLRQAFDKDGNFCRFSPILPETLPFRASIRDFDLDPPLTYKGLKDSYHTGTVLKDKNIHINYCYSSPALRCVQTAAKILEGLQLHNKIKIRIEPGLFECTGWYTASETSNVLTMPRFMTKKEYLENKYAIDKHYHEQMSITELSRLENELEFYQRSHTITTNILKMHETEYITQIQQGQAAHQPQLHILFIAHAPNLETCTRKLCGGKFRPDTLPHVIRNVDFLTMTVIEKTDNNCDKWIFRRSSFYGDEF